MWFSVAGGARPDEGARRLIGSQLPYGTEPRITEAMRRYPQAIAAILRRMNAICVASGRSFGHTSWQASSDMQPNTPSSSPITS